MDQALLTVLDDGPGIPPDHVEHVFDRFYRVEGGQASGSGLGLAIDRELAERMGGSVTVESRPGRTEFTLSLPAAAVAGAGRDARRGLTAFPRENGRWHFDELFYSNFAYQHSTIGSMEDLNAASVADVAQFFKTYYAPNNAVLSLVGDFKPDEALALIRRYFEDIPRQSEPPAVDLSEPEQKAERRETMTRSAGAHDAAADRVQDACRQCSRPVRVARAVVGAAAGR